MDGVTIVGVWPEGPTPAGKVGDCRGEEVSGILLVGPGAAGAESACASHDSPQIPVGVRAEHKLWELSGIFNVYDRARESISLTYEQL